MSKSFSNPFAFGFKSNLQTGEQTEREQRKRESTVKIASKRGGEQDIFRASPRHGAHSFSFASTNTQQSLQSLLNLHWLPQPPLQRKTKREKEPERQKSSLAPNSNLSLPKISTKPNFSTNPNQLRLREFKRVRFGPFRKDFSSSLSFSLSLFICVTVQKQNLGFPFGL